MAISTISPKYFLGSFIPNVKILSAKVDEIINYVNGTQVAVTQGTSITTGVTANATKGVITTVSLTTAAGVTAGPFVVTNSKVLATSVVLVSVEYANGKTGFPAVLVESITAGSFNVRLKNITTGVETLNDVVKVHFIVIN